MQSPDTGTPEQSVRHRPGGPARFPGVLRQLRASHPGLPHRFSSTAELVVLDGPVHDPRLRYVAADFRPAVGTGSRRGRFDRLGAGPLRHGGVEHHHALGGAVWPVPPHADVPGNGLPGEFLAGESRSRPLRLGEVPPIRRNAGARLGSTFECRSHSYRQVELHGTGYHNDKESPWTFGTDARPPLGQLSSLIVHDLEARNRLRPTLAVGKPQSTSEPTEVLVADWWVFGPLEWLTIPRPEIKIVNFDRLPPRTRNDSRS